VTSAGPEYWTASGFTLRSVLARLFKAEESRVMLPGELDRDDRYDFALRLPAPEPQPAVEHRVRQGIERHFRISITRESREEDVYALTSSAGAHLARQRQNEDSGGGVSTGSFEFSTMATEDVPTSVPGREQRASFGNMMMSGITMDDLCRMLEEMFGKPFVNETGLSGAYDVAVEGQFSTEDQFFSAMRGQLGLVVTPARRNLEVVVVRQE
jgi:uncharacterized protein (TIGR03435 family)